MLPSAGEGREYPLVAISPAEVPRADIPLLQHVVDTYSSETNKVFPVWRAFEDSDLEYRPHERSGTVQEIFKHQLLSERRFFGEFLGTSEPPPSAVLPSGASVVAYADRLCACARPRLALLASQSVDWWLEQVPFFDVRRERI